MRTSDQYALVLDYLRYRGILVDLASLWEGLPMTGPGAYRTRDLRYLEAAPPGLRDYAQSLVRCFHLEQSL